MADRRTVGVLATVLVAGVLLVVGKAEPASACSCLYVSPEAAVATSEVVFVGEYVGDRVDDENAWNGTWTFDVVGHVKGDVTGRVEVEGEGWGSSCGNNLSALPQPTVVFASEVQGRLSANSCMPKVAGSQLPDLLVPLPEPDGHGPVALLAALRHKWANLIALDAEARILSWGEVDGYPSGIAPCAGSAVAVVLSWSPDRDHNLLFIDLTTMTEVESRLLIDDRFYAGGDLTCLARDSGFSVWSASGAGSVVVSHAEGSATSVVDRKSGVWLGPSAEPVVVPHAVGGPIEILDPETLEPAASMTLGPEEAGLAAAFDLSGERLAVIVSSSGDPARYRSEGTDVVLAEVGDDSPTRAATIPLQPIDEAWAVGIVWLDDQTLAVEYDTVDSKILDVYDVSGALLSRTDIGWGWGDAVVGGSLVRSRSAGLEMVSPEGEVTPLYPDPGDTVWADPGYVVAVVDGPEIPRLTVEPPVLTWVQVDAATTTVGSEPDETVDGDATLAATEEGPSSDGNSAVVVVGMAAAVLLAAVGFGVVRRQRQNAKDVPAGTSSEGFGRAGGI